MAARIRLLLLLAATVVAMHGVSAQTPPPVQNPAVQNPAEQAAFTSAVTTKDATKRAQAMEIFIAWYPNSVLRIEAYEQTIAAWLSAGNPAKADEVAKKLLQIDPDNVRALANRAYVGRTRAMSGEPDALAPAVAAAERGVAALPKWTRPATVSDGDFVRTKMQMIAIFDGTLGFAALQAKDYAKARTHYLEAVGVDPDNLADVYQLSVAELELQPPDPLGFWYGARAIALARAAKNEQAAAGIDKYVRSRYQRYHGSEDGWEALVTRVAAGEKAPPDGFPKSITRALSPSEAAVQVVIDNDPAQLSYSEWAYVLAHREDSAANKDAAEKVWHAIAEKQKDGARLKIPVKVIAATPDRIEAAITDENQASNTVDLSVTLARPLSPLPAVGAMISIVGTLSDYRLRPFLFLMTKAELADESLPVAGGPCADPRPQMCTRDYRPACGSRRDGSRKTYGNACSACADPEVTGQAAGACPQQ
jgi:tetratricopeptide (TPR) repeat protein